MSHVNLVILPGIPPAPHVAVAVATFSLGRSQWRLVEARSGSAQLILVKMSSGDCGEVGGEGGGVGGASDSSTDLSGQLIRASKDGDLFKVKFLVKVEHVDPHTCRGGENDDAPLHCASYYGHIDIVRYLVDTRLKTGGFQRTTRRRIRVRY